MIIKAKNDIIIILFRILGNYMLNTKIKYEFLPILFGE